ncbi:MAG: hypothetical protein KDI04_05190 [Halieaceae bacterium]|nr:hypothetical protein [Halieaceae bacterium]MCP5147875.1 hypothetical protein [Pseudomonadales bacterium]MCP5187494.1 hypothetical protein [Pseudomonadales bacterium]
MFIGVEFLPGWMVLASSLLMFTACAVAALLAPWAAVRAVPARLHLVLGGAIFCLLLWLMSVHMVAQLWLHFIGISCLVMLLGLRLALLAGALSSFLYAIIIGESLLGVPTAWLLTVLLPGAVSRLVLYAVARLRSKNLFLYMLGGGFCGGMLAMLAMVAGSLLVFWLIDARDWLQSALENWPLVSLVLFPEGFINGMLITTLTVFYPQLVKTFDDLHYLGD